MPHECGVEIPCIDRDRYSVEGLVCFYEDRAVGLSSEHGRCYQRENIKLLEESFKRRHLFRIKVKTESGKVIPFGYYPSGGLSHPDSDLGWLKPP